MTVTEWTSLGDDVARAVGVVVAQAGCSPSEALAVLLAVAEGSRCSIDRTAIDVIERRVRFDRPQVGSMLRRRASAPWVEVGAFLDR